MGKLSKTVTTKKRVIPAKTKVVEIVVCDFCGKKTADHYGNERKCYICGRDICYDHTIFDPNEPSDHPDKWCPTCSELWPPIRRAMEIRHWDEEEKRESEVKAKSLATPIKPTNSKERGRDGKEKI